MITLITILGVFILVGSFVRKIGASRFKRFDVIVPKNRMKGFEFAEQFLHSIGMNDVSVKTSRKARKPVPFSHYNSENKTLTLRAPMYHGRAISAIAIVAHECGHAIQHKKRSGGLKLRSLLLPIIKFGILYMTALSIFILLGHWFADIYTMETALLIIVILQATIPILSLILWPIERDASKRAMAQLEKHNFLDGTDLTAAKMAIKLSANTYLIQSISALSRIFFIIPALFKEEEQF
ncbi:MAG: zinc metallopeptidase [Cryomorphaceae bacterium]|nr:zinc metallopeptidase [Cryomorphaceae bacterium]